MESNTRTGILIAAVVCLTIAVVVIGTILIVNQSNNQAVIQESATQSVIDMAEAMKKNTLEAEAREAERKKEEAKAKEWSDIMNKNKAIMDAVYKK